MSRVSFGKTLRVLSMVGLLLAACGSTVLGASWNGSVSNLWSDNANWDSDPTGTAIDISTGSNMPVLLDLPDSGSVLYMAWTAAQNSSLTIADGADLQLGYGTAYVGIGGTAKVTQTGGNIQAAAIGLADEASAIGTYTISGGTINAIGGSNIGTRGTGTLNIEGGTVTIASWSPGGALRVMGIGASSGGVGLTSSINQTGGTLYATGQLSGVELGVRADSTGVYNLDGGLFKLGTNIVNGAGTGYLKINGGTLQFQDGIDSGKSIDVDYLEIGTKDGVTADYTQNELNDKVLLAGVLTLGSDTSTGTLSIMGGTATVGDLVFGGTTSQVILDDTLSISVLQSNYSVADGLADVAAGYVGVFGGIGSVDVATVDIDGVSYTQLTGTAVPEPSTIVMLSMGLLGMIAYAWRKRR